jgi:peptide/nickel transport system permease protein
MVVFALVHLSGDPAALMLGLEATPEDLERLRHQMGLDQPILVQYIRFLNDAIHLNFGTSLRSHEEALDLALERLPATIELAATGLAISLVCAFPLGIVGALKHGRLPDQVSMGIALLGQSLPGFWLAIMLILTFSVSLRWLPPSGRDGLEHLLLPGFTAAMFLMARTARMVRSSLLEVLNQDYMRTARAKGLTENRVIIVHALKNALIPIVTLIGLDLGLLLSGSVIVETVFAWPGVGLLAYKAILGRDYPVVQAVVFMVASFYVFINLAVDVLYAYLNPRIRYE